MRPKVDDLGFEDIDTISMDFLEFGFSSYFLQGLSSS
jgi:hypothetical protein